MLRYAVIFAILALIAAVLESGGMAPGFASIAKVIFFTFIVLIVVTVLFGASIFRKS